MIPQIVFWLCFAVIFHSYLLYPLILNLLSRNKKANTIIYGAGDELPFVSIIISVHNEEKVIREKILSTFQTHYPPNKFEVLIGSDSSTDQTNQICKANSESYQNFHFFPFPERQGKPAVVNSLVEKARGEILILTDAKVFFEINTIPELIKHFKNSEIDIVGGNIVNQRTNPGGISIQENAFINREIKMKYREGLIWGKSMGVYGAIYAIRKTAFTKVPSHFSVDDFFITMKVLQTNRKVILNLSATSLENVPDDMATEFRRKVRISAGNFQNLRYFISCFRSPFSSLSFIFASHKVIRWLGPFLLIIIFVVNLFLAFASPFYNILFLLQLLLCIVPLIDFLLRKLNQHIIILRFVTHFYAMNFALLVGFFKNITGTRTNIWQPTRR